MKKLDKQLYQEWVNFILDILVENVKRIKVEANVGNHR